MQEILDVVDKNDKVIYQLPKEDVHKGKKIWHREIAVMVLNDKGDLLLQQRSFKKKLFPGNWTVTAVGHVPSGKTPEEAAHMELEEELGFDTTLTFLEKRKYITGDHVSFGYLYKGYFPKDAKIHIEKREVEQAKFATKEEVKQMIEDGSIGPHSAKTLRRFYN